MNVWQAIGAFATASILLVMGLLFMDDRHLASGEKENILLVVAQSSAAVLSQVQANKLQLMQWELNDIIARASAGKPNVGDAARRLVLESRIQELAKK